MKAFAMMIVAGLIALTLGCQNREIEEELNRIKTRIETENRNIKMTKLYIDLINQGKFQKLTQVMSPGYRIYSPSGYPEPGTRQALIEDYQEAKKVFEKFTWSIQDIIVSGDKITCRISVSGLTKPGLTGMPREPREFQFSMITILRFEKGRVIEEWQEEDQLGFARQMGMDLAATSKSAEKKFLLK